MRNAAKVETKDRGSFLPQLTNRWLKVNSVEAEASAFGTARPFGGLSIDGFPVTSEVAQGAASVEAGIEVGAVASGALSPLDPALEEALRERGFGISADLLETNAENANVQGLLDLADGETRVLHFGLSSGNPLLIDRLQIRLATGRVATVVIDVESLDEAEAFRNGTLLLEIGEDADLQLVLLQRLNANTTSDWSVSMRVADGGRLRIAHVELGGGHVNYHLGGDLAGVESAFEEYTAYLTQDEEKLDLFYNVRFHGMFTEGDIHANGAMFDRSTKNFRGTLDFLKGARGAVGNEEEFAMLLSDDVHSVAVPLLLCHEDAVEGNHATSAGRMDEDSLFYLMSRGLSQKDAEGLIVESRMVPTLDRIPDEALREEVRTAIHERIARRAE